MRTRSRVLALVLAAVLGTGGGVGAAYLQDPDERTTADSDPLNLGIALDDLDCSGGSVLVVARGDGAAALAVGVVGNPDLDVRYLRTADSCPTLYGAERGPVPEYAAYVGPYDDPGEPCALRMTDQHRGDSVTRLRAGNTEFVKCVCHLPNTDPPAPTLSVGSAADVTSFIWVRQLQQMLVDLPDERFTDEQVSGVYDRPTAARIAQLQRNAGFGGPLGDMDAATWQLVSDRVCPGYTY